MPLGNMDSMTAAQMAALSAGYQKTQANIAKTGTVNGLTQGSGMNKDGSANTAGVKDLGYGYSSTGDINTAPWHANTYQDSVNNIGKYSTDLNANREALIQSSLKSGNWDAYNQFNNAQNPTQAQQLQQAQQGQSQQGQQGQQGQSQQSQSSGNADLINSMYDQNYASQLQKLKAARDQALAGLAGQEDVIGQNRISQLNNNDATANQQLKALQEVMANNGVKGGDPITATIGNQTAQGQNANQIENNAGNQLTQLTAQRNAINNSASADDLALMQQLQATRSGQLIDNNNTQDQRGLQLAQLMGMYNGQQTLGGQAQSLAAQGQKFNQGIAQAGLTGQYNGQQTMQAQNQGFNQNLATNQFNQGVKNDTFNQGQQGWQNKFNYGQATGQFDNGQTTMDKQKLDVAGQQFAQTMGLNYAQLSLQQQQVLGQLAISQQNANTSASSAASSAANQAGNLALNQSKFAYDSDKNNIDNLYKQSQIDKNTADAQKQGLDDAYFKAVSLAQKDPLFSTYDAAKQSQIINTHYDNLKPKSSVSDSDISSFLKK